MPIYLTATRVSPDSEGYSAALGVNNHGDAVGYHRVPNYAKDPSFPSYVERAFVTLYGGPPTIPFQSGASTAVAINEDRVVAGTWNDFPEKDAVKLPTNRQGFLWKKAGWPSGKQVELLNAALGATESGVLGLSKTFCVGWQRKGTSADTPFRLSLATLAPEPLVTAKLPPEYTHNVSALAVNDNGQFAGVAHNHDPTPWPVVDWDDGAGVQLVGDRPGFAVDINASGTVLLYLDSEAYTLKKGGKPVHVGSFRPNRIADDGTIVGYQVGGAPKAVVHRGTELTVLPAIGGAWTLEDAMDVSPNGLKVVGHGRLDDGNQKDIPAGFLIEEVGGDIPTSMPWASVSKPWSSHTADPWRGTHVPAGEHGRPKVQLEQKTPPGQARKAEREAEKAERREPVRVRP